MKTDSDVGHLPVKKTFQEVPYRDDHGALHSGCKHHKHTRY